MSIQPNILLAGSSVFLSCLFLHVFLWRIRHPRNHVGALLLVFFIPGALLLFCLAVFASQFSTLDVFAAALFFTSLSCTYIQIYPASQADSPSLKILVMVGESMPDGMKGSEIQARFNSEELFTARIQDLLEARLVRQVDNKLFLAPRGWTFLMPFILLRKILGLSAGKG